jgi:hypothetical protein
MDKTTTTMELKLYTCLTLQLTLLVVCSLIGYSIDDEWATISAMVARTEALSRAFAVTMVASVILQFIVVDVMYQRTKEENHFISNAAIWFSFGMATTSEIAFGIITVTGDEDWHVRLAQIAFSALLFMVLLLLWRQYDNLKHPILACVSAFIALGAGIAGAITMTYYYEYILVLGLQACLFAQVALKNHESTSLFITTKEPVVRLDKGPVTALYPLVNGFRH